MSKYRFVDYYAEFCQPCKMMKPLFEKVSEQERFSDVLFESKDVQENMDEATELGIRAVPTLIVFDKDNNVIGRATGFKDETGLVTFLNDSINKAEEKA